MKKLVLTMMMSTLLVACSEQTAKEATIDDKVATEQNYESSKPADIKDKTVQTTDEKTSKEATANQIESSSIVEVYAADESVDISAEEKAILNRIVDIASLDEQTKYTFLVTPVDGMNDWVQVEIRALLEADTYASLYDIYRYNPKTDEHTKLNKLTGEFE